MPVFLACGGLRLMVIRDRGDGQTATGVLSAQVWMVRLCVEQGPDDLALGLEGC
jgi:hypothetical protein